MRKLIANQDTWIKKSTRHSSELPPNKKVFIPKGKEVHIESYKTIENSDNIIAKLAYGQGTWIVYTLHYTGFNDPVSAPKGLDWSDMNCKVSKYFTIGEVTQWDRRRIPQSNAVKSNILKLAKELDKVREAWGKPLNVTSWYRPPAINRAIGGATESQHLNGGAADIKPVDSREIYKFQSWLDDVWGSRGLGYGAKKGFVHVDIRPYRARWNY